MGKATWLVRLATLGETHCSWRAGVEKILGSLQVSKTVGEEAAPPNEIAQSSPELAFATPPSQLPFAHEPVYT